MGGATQMFGNTSFAGLSNAGFTGGKMNPATTAAVTDSSGKLTAYDPTRMAPTTAPAEAPGVAPAVAGMSANGMPSWYSDIIAGGSMPKMGITGTAQQGPLSAALPKPVMDRPAGNGTGAYGGPMPATTTAAKPAAKATTPAAPTLQYVPAIPQQYQVNDQWNSRTGTSQQVASLPRGGVDSGFGMGQAYWLDPKTGMHYADPNGKYQIDKMTAGINPITGRPNY